MIFKSSEDGNILELRFIHSITAH